MNDNEKNEILDSGIESIQVNSGMSNSAIEADYEYEQRKQMPQMEEIEEEAFGFEDFPVESVMQLAQDFPEEYESLKNEYENRTGLSADEFIRKQLEQFEPVKPENEPVSYTLDGNTYSGDLTSHLKKTSEQIDEYISKGKLPEDSRFILPPTPDYLLQTGAKNTNVTIAASVIKKAMNIHGLSPMQIKNAIYKLYDPVIVFDTDRTKSENKAESRLILTDEWKEGKPVAIAVNVNSSVQFMKNGHRIFLEVQDIRSIHDRELIAKNGTDLIQKWTKDGLCRYVDDKKISDWSTVNKVYFPIEALQSDDKNVILKSNIVNPPSISSSGKNNKISFEKQDNNQEDKLINPNEVPAELISKIELAVKNIDSNIKINGMKFYKGLDSKDGQILNIAMEYEGDIHEYSLFDILSENNFVHEGKKVEINPITPAKSGTLDEYIEKVNSWNNEQKEETRRTMKMIDNEQNDTEIKITSDDLKFAKKLIPTEQYKMILESTRGEEGGHFKKIIKEVSDKARAIQGKTEIYTTERKHPLAFKYVIGHTSFYISEWDGGDSLFGYTVLNGDTQNSEWGYISLDEIKDLKLPYGSLQIPTEMIFYGLEDTIEKTVSMDYPELSEKMGFTSRSESKESNILKEFSRKINEILDMRDLTHSMYNIKVASGFCLQTMDISEKNKIIQIMKKCGCTTKEKTDDFLYSITEMEKPMYKKFVEEKYLTKLEENKKTRKNDKTEEIGF